MLELYPLVGADGSQCVASPLDSPPSIFGFYFRALADSYHLARHCLIERKQSHPGRRLDHIWIYENLKPAVQYAEEFEGAYS